MNETIWDTAVIRELLRNAFDSNELKAFCFDYFRPVYDNFSEGMSKENQIQYLLAHSSRYGKINVLLKLTQSHNEFQYNKYKDKLLKKETFTYSEDGQVIDQQSVTIPPPSAEFNPYPVSDLLSISQDTNFRNDFYIRRAADAQLEFQLTNVGTTTVIRAPRQTGKTSLLIRSSIHAKKQGIEFIYISLDNFTKNQLNSFDQFLITLAHWICREIKIDTQIVDKQWNSMLSSIVNFDRFLAQQLLSKANKPIVLAIDEADKLLTTTFFQGFFAQVRAWHNNRTTDEIWDLLNIVLVISTEPYLLTDINSSPFNVSESIDLRDFDASQVRELNRRHGLPSPLAINELNEFMRLLNGHPYLTRLGLYTMVEFNMKWHELANPATFEDGPFSDHLIEILDLIQADSELVLAIKNVIGMSQNTNEKALRRLLRAGIIIQEENHYRCRCDLYRQFFQKKLI
ncbi:MAG: AAA-like domain-containing protein [Anaerolineales bacterium]|nr:AAA-like domain-containing protein [Anaerolineales bacterium]